MTISTKGPVKLGALFENLRDIIARLRDPNGGCPWDLEQTHKSLKPYLIEESYEVLDAIEHKPEKLSEELGDLLLQVMLHSQIGKDSGIFQIDDVVRNISEKLIKRHPHVFGEVKVDGSKQVLENWEKIKREGRPASEGMLDGIPKALPALQRAQRIGSRVARVGFDWNETSEVRAKVREELEEFLAIDTNKESAQRLEEEFGDLLFCLAQLARKMGFNSEDILSRANDKFTDRFRKLETLAGEDLKELSRDRLEELWQQVKRQEQTESK